MAEEPEPRVVTAEELQAFMDERTTAAMEPARDRSPEEEAAAQRALDEWLEEGWIVDPATGRRFAAPPSGTELDDGVAREDVEKGIHHPEDDASIMYSNEITGESFRIDVEDEE